MSPQIRSLFLEQIRHADLILANKMDLLSDKEQGDAVFGIQSLNSDARIVQTYNAKIPFNLLQGLSAAPKGPVEKAEIGKLNLNTKVLRFEQPVNREHFEDWLRELPETVYRIKGY